MGHPWHVKFYGNKIETEEVENILSSFPELNSGANGLYNITALQVAAAFTKQGVTSRIKQLVETNSLEYINQGDQLGRTPLHYAVMNGNTELVRYLLDNEADTECRFLYMCSLRTSHKDYNKWNKLYSTLPPPDDWGRTPLHRAAKDCHLEIVKLLIERKANVNAKDEKSITPLLLAGGNKNNSAFEAIVECLIQAGADVNIKNNVTGTSALFHAVALKNTKATQGLLKAGAWLSEGPCQQTELHEAAANGISDILDMFLEDSRITPDDVNKPDGCGRTALFRAAHGGHKECLKALINKGGSLAHVSKTKETVMDVIFARITRPAQFIKELLDSRITGNYFKQAGDILRVNLDFNILAPNGNDHQMEVISNILEAANEQQKVEILQHPLIESFLRLKWAKIRQFFFLLIFSYTWFVLSLSIFVVLVIHYPGQFEVLSDVARYFVIVTAGGLSGHAIIQCSLLRRNFFRQYELWMNLTCTVLSLVVAISCRTPHLGETIIDSSDWILHASSIAILLAWTELMLLIGRFPTYGYYALMFAAVLQNVIKVLLTFVCLVIGFALSFSIQFYNYEQFTNPWRALVKTTVMMMGEFEYSDLFADSDSEETHSRLSTTSRLIFLVFIVLASIVLMNLMVGLAVSDIQGLQEEGHARRLEKQAEFLRQLEKVISVKVISAGWFPGFIRRFLKRKRCIALRLTIQPEHTGSIISDPKNARKLPCELIESIMEIVTNQQNENDDVFKAVRFEELLEALRIALRRCDRRMTK